ncbi:gamma-glutamyltransferase family protein [Halobacillus sp. KGW1]|uniref:gamma-glutamyltransferase family protein n=1 Tax=Halobacillus sp. KGW1 TaxID=1793726 RepID=UPI0007805018|nr:gamma-glutamyltransferase [Halobacillus sp. KGW1]
MENKGIFITLFIVVILGVGFIYYSQGKFDFLKSDETDYEVESTPALETANGYGVSSSHPLAVKVGMEVLENGGNAVDAAVAVSYTLGVVEPYGSGIGGGGEMLVLPSGEETPVNYKYKEIAPPSGAKPASNFAIPGVVKGMEAVHEDYGTVDMAELIEPAIGYAENGFANDRFITERLTAASYRMRASDTPNFFPEGRPIQPNETLVQKNLAETLRLIQKDGADAFYNGPIADEIVAHVDGLKKSDFTSYEIQKDEAVHGKFAGYDVYSAAPPLAGPTLIQSLQMADMLDIKSAQGNDADFIHLIGEISKRTYHDRLSEIADPRYFDNDFDKLTDIDYAEEMASTISMDRLSEDYQVNDSVADEEDDDNTTHFVVIDKDGMVVTATHSLSNFFGSGQNVAGVFLNDTMRNFSKSETGANKYEPGKHPRSFTAPTILRNEDQLIGIGTPGGKRIPMVLTQVLTRNLVYEEPLEDAVKEPRFYIEDDDIYVEKEFDEETRQKLTERGYTVHLEDSPFYYGGIQGLVVDKQNSTMYGVGDDRRGGAWQVKEE